MAVTVTQTLTTSVSVWYSLFSRGVASTMAADEAATRVEDFMLS